MISQTDYERIKKLLRDSTLSQRAIGYKVGVSRGTVLNIANEKVPRSYEKPPAIISSFTGKCERCPHCGVLVRMPCLACLIEEQGEARAKARRKERSRSEKLESRHG